MNAGYDAVTTLCNAIHQRRCGSSPDHGPYQHEEEAQEYIDLLADLGHLRSTP